MYVKRLNVASMPFAAPIIIIVHNANVCQVTVAIPKLSVLVPNVRQISNVPTTWHASMKSVAIHVIVAKEHYVASTIIDQHANVHPDIREILASVVQLLYEMSQSVAWMAIVQVNWRALVAFVRILVTKLNHVLNTQVAALSIRYL